MLYFQFCFSLLRKLPFKPTHTGKKSTEKPPINLPSIFRPRSNIAFCFFVSYIFHFVFFGQPSRLCLRNEFSIIWDLFSLLLLLFFSFRLVMLVALVLINWLVYALVGGLAEAEEQLRGDCKSWALSKSTWIYYKFIKMVLGCFVAMPWMHVLL